MSFMDNSDNSMFGHNSNNSSFGHNSLKFALDFSFLYDVSYLGFTSLCIPFFYGNSPNPDTTLLPPITLSPKTLSGLFINLLLTTSCEDVPPSKFAAL